jgi:sialic acid synthase
MYKKCIVISEIGASHLGRMDIAFKHIDAAVEAGTDIIKFQKRNPYESLTKEQQVAPHPHPEFAYGNTYLAHRLALELSLDQHKILKDYIENKGKIYSTSVWDCTSAKEIIMLKPKLIKVASATNLNWKVHEILCDEFEGEIHISLGMTTKKEIEDIIRYYVNKKRNKDVVLYHCTSGYPVDFPDVCLLEITWLKNQYGNIVKDIGFSGHHLGMSVDIAAYTLGANYIERHFTFDRNLRHTDIAASLGTNGLRILIRNLEATRQSLSYKETDILPVEEVQRKKLKI